jgi:tocopherol O-methyltransferase
MITSRKTVTPRDVAGHYDDLDRFYREICGEHLHHGFWVDGVRTQTEAAEKMIDLVAGHLHAEAGDHVGDVGCGYGGTSRYLAEQHQLKMTGITVSRVQYDYAVERSLDRDNPRYLLENWEENSLAANSLDGIVSIECLAHVPDKQKFFDQVDRVLKPGKRAVVLAWLAKDAPRRWEHRHLLEPICREGRLPSMGSEQDYAGHLRDAGLKLIEFRDLTRQVQKSLTVGTRQVYWNVCTRPSYWNFLWQRKSSHAVYLFSLIRMIIAYRTGAFRYGMYVAEKPF